jgi:adenylate cyclase class 2
MNTEIEAKLKIDSPEEVVEKLTQLGAAFLEEQLQTDLYFDDADKTLTKTDRCLRLRRQLVGQSEKIFLTYKAARQKSEFKKRHEIELEITDADSMENLLSALAYEKMLVFEKRRRIWRVGQCSIALDELPLLGDFVEIEGPDNETIAGVQRDLGLSDLPHIKESYADLIAEKLRQQT